MAVEIREIADYKNEKRGGALERDMGEKEDR